LGPACRSASPGVEWLGHIYVLFGGLAGARIAHRVAAVVMIINWIWHTLYLLYRWRKHGFSFKSWSMWPNRKDWADFIAVSKYYLGLSKEEPRYDRFQFREKFDYFAVYWGMPIMVFSGLVLWFPIYFGNRLPEIGLSFDYIAHSNEAILAFLAIVLWHFYNTHFNPDNFPMSPTWYTGTKTQEERAREHPLELARLEGQNPGQAAGATVPPPPRPPDAPAGGDPPRGANG
jgi:cytochrome b subunit of formate dehydrogenase